MFLPLLGYRQVKTIVHYSQTTLANVYILHLLLFLPFCTICRIRGKIELKLKLLNKIKIIKNKVLIGLILKLNFLVKIIRLLWE
jgi:hypothetical protein